MFLTDKVTLGYLPTYLQLAGRIGTAGRVCEVGVQRGYSLEMWQSLFPDGIVAGVDSDPAAHWPAGTKRIISNQNDPELPDRLARLAPSYHLIVDDASHQGNLTRATFDLLWPLVVPGGTYVIEDWQVGFPGEWDGLFDGSMVDLARDLLDLLNKPGGEVDQITYRFGMILLRRAGGCAS